MATKTIKERIELTQSRLDAYYEQERKMLADGVQAYGIGSRNVQRYNIDLGKIQAMIKMLEAQLEQLEREQSGKATNRRYTFVPTDL